MTTSSNEPRGIGGWLILPIIGLIFTVCRFSLTLKTYVTLFTGPAWERLTTEGSPVYHPLSGPLLIFEAIGNLSFVCAAIVLLVLIFLKHPLLPKMMIGFHVLNLVFVSLDGALASFTPLFASAIPVITEELTRSIISAAIWIPYFLRSRRVKNTFVKRDASASAAAAPLSNNPPSSPPPLPTTESY
jgi:hypothetical protein